MAMSVLYAAGEKDATVPLVTSNNTLLTSQTVRVSLVAGESSRRASRVARAVL